jgi:predicted nuclease of predicted toxin-antitoxin system
MQFIVDESTGVADILERAAREDRTLITNDKDFGKLVFRSGQPHHGVILLRLQDESSANRVRMVQVVLEKYAGRLTGHFIVATERGIRLRPTAGPP